MKLHANAALSLNQRRRLARRIVDQGWTVAEVLSKSSNTGRETCGSISGAISSRHTSSRLRNPSRPSRNRRNGTIAVRTGTRWRSRR